MFAIHNLATHNFESFPAAYGGWPVDRTKKTVDWYL